MSEAFLHYIWQHQYFDKKNLLTTNGEEVSIIKTGFHNYDSGPDFKQAKVLIDDLEWVGHIEIHFKSSDWYVHNHHSDRAYDNTILHVVWEDDKPVNRTDQSSIPTIELQNRIYLSILKNHDRLINNPQNIPCREYIGDVSEITKISALDNALVERLERKSEEVFQIFQSNNRCWDETVHQLLAKSMGFKKNSEPLFELAKIITLKILGKHIGNIFQIEALLFGASGLLIGSKGKYANQLLEEYKFLKTKYQLDHQLNVSQWKFSRLRPANFPTVRIAQLASLINSSPRLFTNFLENEPKTIISLFRPEVSDYWAEHYAFGKKSMAKRHKLGYDSASLLCINVVAPTLTAYSKYIDNQQYQDKALELLSSLKAENNKITREMSEVGFKNESAHDSQALIELFNNYCLKKRCLSCNVGANIIAP